MPFRRRKILPLQSALQCAVYVFLLACLAKAQYRFDSWTTDGGLPQNSVYAIVQTPDGYLWFTTLDGLVRFDGVKFKVFNKSNSPNFNNNRLQNVYADGETLWIAPENGGLVRYRNGEFKTFTTADGLPSNIVFGVQKDADGSLLIFVGTGIARTRDDGASFALERAGDPRSFHVYYGASGAEWELNENGLRARRNGETRNYPLPFDARRISDEPDFNVFILIPMFEDERGALWFAAAGNLYRFQDGGFTAFTKENGMPASHVQTIAEDAAGDIWFGTQKDGACRLAADRITCYGTEAGLSSNDVKNIFLDRENTLWIGTNNAGLNRVSKQIVTPLSTAHGLFDKNVYPILQTRSGDFWIGATSALSQVQNGTITNYTERDGLIHPIVQSLFEDLDGRLWVGSGGGAQYLQDGKFVEFTGAPEASEVGSFRDIHQTADGALWFATNVGLYKYADGAVTRLTTNDGLPSDDVNAILEARDGSLWIATTGGAAHLKNNRLTIFTEKDGLAGNFVRSIYEDETGAIWLGTYDSGLSLYRDGRFTNFNTGNGLFSSGVFAILPDARGNFWMSSNQGIYRVNRQQLIDYADGKISSIVSTAFNKSDGMLNTECNGGRQPAGIRASDGRLWFPTQDGVAIVDPEAVRFNPLAPPVVIENVTIENKPIEDFQSKIQNPKSKIEIAPGQNNLEIDYTGLSFIKPEQVRFRYKLEGLDNDWIEAGARRTAFYPFLPPGDYTFRVIAANSDDVWNQQGASLSITVLPPFYRTWWFFALAVLTAAAIGLLIFRLRIRQIERKHAQETAFSRRLIDSQEQERRRIAAELHDSLGQLLVIIKNRARMSLKNADNSEQTVEHLDEISTASSQAIEEVKEISFDLRPYLLDKLGLTKTIKSMLTKVFASSETSLETEIDDIDDAFPKDSEILFYRIIQESASNIVKHAAASVVEVIIKRDSDKLLLRISDDGKGFDPAAQARSATRSFGLIGIAERARLLGGKYSIASEVGKGTLVTVEVELQNERQGRN